MTGSSIAAGASSCSTVTSLVSSIFYFCSGPETDKNPPPTDDAGSPTPTEGVPVGTYKIPEGTVAYSVVRLTGDIKVLPVDEDATDGTGRRMGINVVSSAGINIVDERNYSFAWLSGRSTTPGSRVGSMTLEDNLFGALRRTAVEPLEYDEAQGTLVCNAAWEGRWLGFNINVPISVTLTRDEQIAPPTASDPPTVSGGEVK